MLKKIILILFLFTGLSAFADENYLNSVIINNVNNETSVILRSDAVASLKRKILAPDKIILTVKGLTQSPNITTLYKNTPNANGVTIQNDGDNSVIISIQAPDISKAGIVFETPDASPVLVSSKTDRQRTIWFFISLLLLVYALYSAKRSTDNSFIKDINELNKEREKALYQNFKKEIALLPDKNYKLKSYKKYVLNGGTLRNYSQKSMLLK